MAERDDRGWPDVRRRVNICPTGRRGPGRHPSPIDRRPGTAAENCGFESLYANSLDAVSDRDFAANSAPPQPDPADLSRLLKRILGPAEEFSFVRLHRPFCATGQQA